MTSIIAFTPTDRQTRTTFKAPSDNVVSLDEWRRAPHPVRTPSGVFFVTNMWGSSGDAA